MTLLIVHASTILGDVHPRAVNNLALHTLTAAFAADHAIVDEKAARIAIAEITAD
jgi:type II secretory pathway predicted ATPase ExeA